MEKNVAKANIQRASLELNNKSKELSKYLKSGGQASFVKEIGFNKGYRNFVNTNEAIKLLNQDYYLLDDMLKNR